MGWKDALKNVSNIALEKTKEAVDTKIQDVEDKWLENRELKAEEKVIKKSFSPDKKIGTLQVDMSNKLFKIKNATAKAFEKKDGMIKKTAKLATGVSLIKAVTKPADRIFNFSDVIDFELLEDDISIASGGLGRAVVGAVAFGGVGAIVGGVTGTRTTKKKITQLILKITINDVDMPCIMLPYITKPTKTDSKEYKEAFNEAHQVLSMLNVIVNNTLVEDNVENIPTTNNLEQIKKLKELLDLGAISQEEFDVKKKELLGI